MTDKCKIVSGRGRFEDAALRLSARFERRFGREIARRKCYDATVIKDRWYGRMTCQFVRDRLVK